MKIRVSVRTIFEREESTRANPRRALEELVRARGRTKEKDRGTWSRGRVVIRGMCAVVGSVVNSIHAHCFAEHAHIF